MKKGMRKKVCKYGHPLTGKNLRIIQRKRKGKIYIEHGCRECERSRYFSEASDE